MNKDRFFSTLAMVAVIYAILSVQGTLAQDIPEGEEMIVYGYTEDAEDAQLEEREFWATVDRNSRSYENFLKSEYIKTHPSGGGTSTDGDNPLPEDPCAPSMQAVYRAAKNFSEATNISMDFVAVAVGLGSNAITRLGREAARFTGEKLRLSNTLSAKVEEMDICIKNSYGIKE